MEWQYHPKKGSRIIVISFNQTLIIVKVYFTILDVFKLSSLGYNYEAIWKFEKNEHFWKKSKFEIGISSKKRKQGNLTSFNQIYTIMKVYFSILNILKISSLGYNYAAIWKLWRKGIFLKKIEIWNGNIVQKKESRHNVISFSQT